MLVHPIAPIYNKESKVLILGSFPSVKSREQCFFYGHPQNRFWRVLAAVFDQPTPNSIEEKKSFLLQNKVALWDVIASCEIVGSADSTIKNALPNDLEPLLAESNIKKVFVNGNTAKKLYDRHILPKIGIESVALPSTSPANASWRFEQLVERWKIIVED